MGKRINLLLAVMIFTVILACPYSYADGNSVSSDKQRITVQDDVPAFMIYCEEYDHNALEDEDILVQMYSGDKEILTKKLHAEKFESGENKEGITYFLLIDTSRSMNNYEEQSFSDLKRTIINFTQNQMDSKDKVFVLPFNKKEFYNDKVGINPTTSELKDEINRLEATGTRSNIYDAIEGTVELAEKIESNDVYPQRMVALLFTDACEFNDGGDEATAADVEMVSAGISLHAFTIGKNKEQKNELRKFAVRSGGRIFDGNTAENLKESQKILNETLVINFSVKNPTDLVGTYSVKVYQGDTLIGEKAKINAPNTAELKDDMSVTIKKAILTYWWIILIAAIAVIAIIVLIVIKKNKGIVTVNGEVVYGKNLRKKYHVKVKEHDTKTLTIGASVKGGTQIRRDITLVRSLIVGRANLCDLYFDDEKMSRQHFVIEMTEGEMYIEDLDSTGGTYLNGVRVYMKQKLAPGDVITAGTTKIVVEW